VDDSVRQPTYEFEGFRLDAQRRVLFANDGHPIPLTPKLLDLLLYLVERPGRLLTKEKLLEAIWPQTVVEEHNLNKAISELRRVFGEKPSEHRFIATQPGRGYRFVADVSTATAREIEAHTKRDDPPLEPAPLAPATALGSASGHIERASESAFEAPGESTTTETGGRWRPRNLRLVGVLGTLALLAAAVGFSVFDAATPHSDRGLRVTQLLFEKDGGEVPHVIGSTVWKPDGRAIAFSMTASRNVPGPPQPYVLYLDGSSPQPLTQQFARGLPKLWTPAGHVLLNTSRGPDPTSESAGLWTVPAVGGEPEPLFTFPRGTTNILSITADGATLAALRRDGQGIWGIWVGAIANGTLERYEPTPFAPIGFVNIPTLSFSPDGRQLLLMWNPAVEGEPQGEQAWLLPYPPDPEHPPQRILKTLPSYSGTPSFSWLPDNQHIVVSAAEQGKPWRLYLADTQSERFQPLTDRMSTALQFGPVVSPDGTRFVFSEITPNLDIVTMNVHTGEVTALIATNRIEQMPAWAADGGALVYVTERNGELEIWLRERDGRDRPLVRPKDFPAGTTSAFMVPEISPDGTRVTYLRVERDARGATGARLWMSSLSGGAPMRLRDRAAHENPGSWSPDSAWYVYEEVQGDGSRALRKARTSGTSEPETLATGISSESVPVWSTDGRWILFDDDGLKLIAADGSETRELGVKDALCTFARAPELLYCIEIAAGKGNLVTRSFDGAARVVSSVAQEHWPAASGSPGLRLSLTPDGEGVTYSVGSARVQLLLAEGLADVPLP
jgi:DNA-binding winged helix-turn-helix (wHTH) protein/Tol biopolymer transport system component